MKAIYIDSLDLLLLMTLTCTVSSFIQDHLILMMDLNVQSLKMILPKLMLVDLERSHFPFPNSSNG